MRMRMPIKPLIRLFHASGFLSLGLYLTCVSLCMTVAESCLEDEFWNEMILDCDSCTTYCKIGANIRSLQICKQFCVAVYTKLMTTTPPTTLATITTVTQNTVINFNEGILAVKNNNLRIVLCSILVSAGVAGIGFLLYKLHRKYKTSHEGAKSRTPSSDSDSSIVSVEEEQQEPTDNVLLTVEADLAPARSPEIPRCVLGERSNCG